jgi:hypothetical protein
MHFLHQREVLGVARYQPNIPLLTRIHLISLYVSFVLRRVTQQIGAISVLMVFFVLLLLDHHLAIKHRILIRLSLFILILLLLTLGIYSEASTHVTPDLNCFTSYSPYVGSDQLYVGNGKDLQIFDTGSTFMVSNSYKLVLTNVLHVPSITKPLISISKLVTDNNVYVVFNDYA